VNREEKEILYTFLDTARRVVSGGTEPAGTMPAFADDGETALSSAESITDVNARIASCARCGLCRTRTNAVPGVGSEEPLVMVIGDFPGADEDERGEPFVGKAGQLLDKMLSAIALSRDSNCFITNLVKCRPSDNRDPTSAEVESCVPFLLAQIEALEPRAILAVGEIAAQTLLETKAGIGGLRGTIYDYHGIPLMPTYHPGSLLRDENLKRPAWEDLKKFRTEILDDGNA